MLQCTRNVKGAGRIFLLRLIHSSITHDWKAVWIIHYGHYLRQCIARSPNGLGQCISTVDLGIHVASA